MRAIYVPIDRDTFSALVTLAGKEYRDPRRQASFLVVEGLRRAGLLTEEAKDDQQEVANAAAVR